MEWKVMELFPGRLDESVCWILTALSVSVDQYCLILDSWIRMTTQFH